MKTHFFSLTFLLPLWSTCSGALHTSWPWHPAKSASSMWAMRGARLHQLPAWPIKLLHRICLYSQLLLSIRMRPVMAKAPQPLLTHCWPLPRARTQRPFAQAERIEPVLRQAVLQALLRDPRDPQEAAGASCGPAAVPTTLRRPSDCGVGPGRWLAARDARLYTPMHRAQRRAPRLCRPAGPSLL
jgi:hypothetical protein